MILTQILRVGCVKVPIESNEKISAITELVDLLDNEGLFRDRQAALDAVLTREQTRSTGIGSGIAIPHGKSKAVKELVMSIGIAKEPIDFESVDDKPVRIILLLVSPVNQTGPHIQALAQISRLMLDENFKGKIENAETAEEVYELIRSKESD